jgi:coniferyl-aldehyde dehydrogenase
MQTMTSITPERIEQQLTHILKQQKQAYQRYPMPSAKDRIERLDRLKAVLVKYQDQFAEAISQDFGNRALGETRIGEILTCLEQIRYYRKNLTAWMKPEKRHISWLHQPAKGWVQFQPLGVIGIIAPWNYPLLLSIGPLICALAAGNHILAKFSILRYLKHFHVNWSQWSTEGELFPMLLATSLLTK